MVKGLPLWVLGVFVLLTLLIVNSRPSVPQREKPQTPKISVATQRIAVQRYRIELNSFGTVQPRTRSQLVSQVAGQIISVSPSFREGGFFEAGDLLVEIDPRDYDIQIEVAESELADAKVNLEEQLALAQQAEKDWRNIGAKGQASALALRRPQVAAAEAQIVSARAKLKQAKLNRERTQIRAPFAGRVLTQNVDLGQVIANNTVLAQIYGVDTLEIRLPLKNSELGYIDLPEAYRVAANGKNEAVTQDTELPQVTIINNLGATPELWSATLVRTAGAFDDQTHELYVIAQIENPYGQPSVDAKQSLRRPLKIGQYVDARIQGKMLTEAVVIPNESIYQGSYVYLVKDGLLQRQTVHIAWQNDREAVVSGGLMAGDELVLTPLGQVSSGTPVKVTDTAAVSQREASP